MHGIGFDAFSFDWGGHNNYCLPPPNLIINVLKHMQFCNAKGCIVVPEWTGHKFWPLLGHCDGPFHRYVTKKWVLPKIKDMFIMGKGGRAIYVDKKSKFDGTPDFNVIAFYVDFS